ncbi:MAG: hypothetical protein RLZZ50_387 [Verrucomicrobiota bacterium]|jgi:hypothetical protein
MPTLAFVTHSYPHAIVPHSLADIPRHQELVYGLIVDDVAVVCGRGTFNRAKVVFDGAQQTTVHIKAMTVRLHRRYGPPHQVVERFVIPCASKAEALAAERDLHARIGGAGANIPPAIQAALLAGLAPGSPVSLLLRAALVSAYDGLSDLRRWRDAGIGDAATWEDIQLRLAL